MDTSLPLPLHVAVELDGAGRHPAAWRRADSRAEHLFSPAHWAALARAADGAGVGLLLLADEFSVHSAGAGLVRGRLEAPALAARLALETGSIGLVPVGTVTHTEPFHVAKSVASLDHVSHGRAGWEVAVSRGQAGTALVGRGVEQDEASLWAEAGEAVEVARRLWDSWEDDAEIRDVATGRFVDRDRLHYVDFVGEHFSVKGPSITPRSPQGQPLVVVRADGEGSVHLAARQADVVRIAAPTPEAAAQARQRVHDAVRGAGRDPGTVTVLLDVEVLTAPTQAQADAELAELDRWASHRPRTLSHTGTAETLAQLLDEVRRAGAADGVTLVPLALPSGLDRLAQQVLPALRAAGAAAPPPPPGGTLRERFGLTRPGSAYAPGSTSTPGAAA